MTTRATWLRNQIVRAERVCADYRARGWPCSGMSRHIEDLRRELAEEEARTACACHSPIARHAALIFTGAVLLAAAAYAYAEAWL